MLIFYAQNFDRSIGVQHIAFGVDLFDEVTKSSPSNGVAATQSNALVAYLKFVVHSRTFGCNFSFDLKTLPSTGFEPKVTEHSCYG